MPELPEVETIVRGLGAALVARRVAAVHVRAPRLGSRLAPEFSGGLEGRRIEALSRRGKSLVAALDDGRLWLVPLGMTGQLTLTRGAGRSRPHDHVVVELDDGGTLTYNDTRRFGWMAGIEPGALAAPPGSGVAAPSPALTPDAPVALRPRRAPSGKAFLF